MFIFRVSDKVFPSLLHYKEAVSSSPCDNRSVKIFSQLFTCLFSCLLFPHKGHTLLPSWAKASGRWQVNPWQFPFAPPAVQFTHSLGPGPSPPCIQAGRRWRVPGLILQFRNRSGKITLGKAGVISLHHTSTLVSPLDRSALTCGPCSASPAPSEESGQTTASMPSGFLRKVFFKGHILLFPDLGSSRSSFGSISAETTNQISSLFPPRYTPQLNGRADAEPLPAWRQGTLHWNMNKDLVGEEGREPCGLYKLRSYFNLTA